MAFGGHIVRTKRDWIDFFPMLEVGMSRYLGMLLLNISGLSGHIEKATLCLGEVNGLIVLEYEVALKRGLHMSAHFRGVGIDQ